MDYLKFLPDPLNPNTNEEEKEEANDDTLNGPEISPTDLNINKRTLSVKVRDTSSSRDTPTPSAHNIFNQIDDNTLINGLLFRGGDSKIPLTQ